MEAWQLRVGTEKAIMATGKPQTLHQGKRKAPLEQIAGHRKTPFTKTPRRLKGERAQLKASSEGKQLLRQVFLQSLNRKAERDQPGPVKS